MELSSYKLEDISEGFFYGSMPDAEDLCDVGYPVFSGYRVVGCSTKYNIKKRSLAVIARGVGGTGRAFVVEKNTFLTNLSIAIPINEDLADIDFIMNYLNIQGLRYLDSGAAQSQITINNLRHHRIFIPTVEIQKRVSNILLYYDRLVKSNNKRIKVLEQMAENLYKEWFVRFRFPGHENAEFENRIPQGWSIKKLSEISTFTYGKMPDADRYIADGYPIFSGYRITGYYDSFLFEKPMLVLIARGVGGTGEVRISPPFAYITNLSIVFLLFNPELYLNYLYQLFSLQNLKYLDTGAAQSQITIDNLKNVRIVLPPDDLLVCYNSKVELIKKQIETLSQINTNLTKQRDLLLPRLMSGKLEV